MSEDQEIELTPGGDGIRARLTRQQIVIEDRSDGHFVVLSPDEADDLRRWLAEIL